MYCRLQARVADPIFLGQKGPDTNKTRNDAHTTRSFLLATVDQIQIKVKGSLILIHPQTRRILPGPGLLHNTLFSRI